MDDDVPVSTFDGVCISLQTNKSLKLAVFLLDCTVSYSAILDHSDHSEFYSKLYSYLNPILIIQNCANFYSTLIWTIILSIQWYSTSLRQSLAILDIYLILALPVFNARTILGHWTILNHYRPVNLYFINLYFVIFLNLKSNNPSLYFRISLKKRN